MAEVPWHGNIAMISKERLITSYLSTDIIEVEELDFVRYGLPLIAVGRSRGY